ncbi:hypothetical protein [Amycolatopsis sp. NPDC004169]|uniref:hypothetical protein n=1 Tax=Amycolatopsis sp. NPDC004169 TaxID=3154453 RepID=UPI0033BA40BD
MRIKSLLLTGVAVMVILTAEAGAASAEAASAGDAVARHFATAAPFAEATARTAQNVVITEVQKGKRNPNKIAECYQAQGGNCTISQSVALQATVSSTVGVSFEMVNAQLGNSYSKTLTTQISCSNNLAPRQYLRAYPSGDFVFFEANGAKGTAFLPTGIQCQIEQ